VHSDYGEDARVLLNGVNCIVSVFSSNAHNMMLKTTTPQPFYGPFSGTTWVSQCQKRTSGLYGARED